MSSVYTRKKKPLRGRNEDVVTAWRIYERTARELGEKTEQLVQAAKTNREAYLKYRVTARVQTYWIAALTISVLLTLWRMW
jgi:hypothetical protein